MRERKAFKLGGQAANPMNKSIKKVPYCNIEMDVEQYTLYLLYGGIESDLSITEEAQKKDVGF